MHSPDPNPASTAILSWSGSLATGNFPLGSAGTILIAITPPNPVFTVAGLYPISDTLSLGAIPESGGLVGLELFTQAAYVETNGVFGFTNALDYTIGTH